MTQKSTRGHVLCVVGARPNFMKIAPIMRAFSAAAVPIPCRLVHTGQHYDAAMKASFFTQLRIPEPDLDLGVGSGSHAVQTAEIMKRFEPELDANPPRAVLVVGDVNSTIACSLVAVKKAIPVIHVEAGLRSGDRAMPEEINRILTDQLSDLLFTTELDAAANLQREGIDPARVLFVGNVMIDSLMQSLELAIPAERTFERFAEPLVAGEPFGLVTLHRPSNVDDPEVLETLLDVLCEISADMPLLFPMHPRTRAKVEAFGLEGRLASSGIRVTGPLSYLEMLGVMQRSALVLTDSGGLQEETTALGIPCLTLRHSTERPITVTEGTNTIVGTAADRIFAAYREFRQTGGKAGRVPPLWDGRAAERIAGKIGDWLVAG
ncbi:non-hydrolyzing UDP-N-acetylglucosamine 2-epimerase [Parahaliea aestuarii]|uniref:UDP-N-acetylglucosamine 2-epimerase (Non-hydrolyzing) n=1 Tax=Parahaliea aestuarii TaxID=1852021 RepID=A0A5C8ZPL5_9GAMM|nr:UDP-N-acetylglucosamine 2-epimerase (non-hydrolyzing) [Parahaliea aestuarii]TXS89652.1 UDP-N-acetylglucosamine 2-epimerase (non-hydrolyzing) [Parahaliea aestuarii]